MISAVNCAEPDGPLYATAKSSMPPPGPVPARPPPGTTIVLVRICPVPDQFSAVELGIGFAPPQIIQLPAADGLTTPTVIIAAAGAVERKKLVPGQLVAPPCPVLQL